MFDLKADPVERHDVAAANPEIAADLTKRLLAYARGHKPSLWLKAQPSFIGTQDRTIFHPDFDIDDGGLPHEKPALPATP